MKAKIDSLYAEFIAAYPYVSVDRRVVERFVREYRSQSVHFLYDFILSQGLEDDIEI